MEETKLSLSPEEWSIVADPEIILTKNAVLHKIKASLELLSRWQLDFVKENTGWLPAAWFAHNGKISKGENYNGLPYLILDYPRHFRPDHIFAVRSLFWWGKQVSITLHLSGAWKEQFAEKLAGRFEQLKTEAPYLSCNGDEWEHDIHGGSYVPLHGLESRNWTDLLSTSRFIKLADAVPMNQLENAPEFWRQKFRNVMELLR